LEARAAGWIADRARLLVGGADYTLPPATTTASLKAGDARGSCAG
jgi:hypothetical protein